MPPINLTERGWHDIDPSFRTVIDKTPHVVAYDETDDHLRLFPVAFIPTRRTELQLEVATA